MGLVSGLGRRSQRCVGRVILLLGALLQVGLRSSGAQSFAQPTVVPTGSWPVAVYTADFNEDGKPDLLYIDTNQNGEGTAHVLLNQGNGSFKQSYTQLLGPTVVALGDLLGNGHVDIGIIVGQFVPGQNDVSIEIFGGNGDGTFRSNAATSARFSSPATQAYQFTYVMAARLRASGPLDFIAEDSANNTMLTFQANASTFSLTSGYTVVTGLQLVQTAGPMVVGDVNGDGYPDVLIDGQEYGAVDVHLGTSTGLSTATPNHAISGPFQSIVLQDVTGDGKLDLIAETTAGEIRVLPGDGTGYFPFPIGGTGTLNGTTGNGGHLIAVADVNHDGLPDALTATPVGISTLLGQGTAYFGLKGIYNAGPGHASYAVADFNGDGNLDVALDSPEGVAILYGNADGSFQTSQAYAAGQPALSGALGVFTASGNTDAVVSTGATQAQVLKGGGDGTFAAIGLAGVPAPTSQQNGSAGLWSTVQTGDFNGDGKLDLLLTADGPNALLPAAGGTAQPGAVVQLGMGDGTFAAGSSIPYASYAGCSAWPEYFYGRSVVADFNGDGRSDLANRDAGGMQALTGSTAAPYVMTSFNEGDTTCPNLHAHDQIAVGELYGADDLVWQSDSHLYVQIGLSSVGLLEFLQAGDLSLDGSLTTPGQLVAPQLSSTFGGVSPTLGFPAFIGSMVIADVDGDGYNDVVVAYDNMGADHTAPTAANPNYIYIWYGNGSGKFPTSKQRPANPVRLTPSRNFYQVAVADVNGDGIPDLLLSDGYVLSVQLGAANGSLGPEQHFLAGQGINAITVADLRHSGRNDLVIANGGAVLSNPVANHDALAANQDVNTGGITVLLNHATPTTVTPTGTLTASPEPSAFEGAFTITAVLQAAAGIPAPMGTVNFFIDGKAVGSGMLSSGSASVTIAAMTPNANALLPGTHTLTANYAGDTNYSATSLTGTHTVSLGPTSVVLTPTTPLQIYYGQGANGIFTISVLDAAYFPATGTYTLYDNNVQAAVCIDLPITAVCPYGDPVPLDAGSHSFTISYNGDAVNAYGISVPVVYVISPDPTNASVTSSVNPSFVGQPVYFTAAIGDSYTTAQGSVQFFDGSTLIGTATLNAQGTATVPDATLAVGSHTITACLVASLDYLASCSPPITQVVTLQTVAVKTVTLLTSSANPSIFGQTVAFSAAVETTGAFVTTPAGTLSFYDGTTLLYTATLDKNGDATFTTTSLAVGTHPITAAYAGNQATAASTSAVLSQVVLTALTPETGYVLTVNPASVSVGVGNQVTVSVTVTGVNPSGQPFQLGCTYLPKEAGCGFGQSTLPANGGTTTLTISAAAPHNCGSSAPYFVASNTQPKRTLPLLALAGFGILLMRKRRKLLRGLLLAALLCAVPAGIVSITGCTSGCTDFGTQPYDYTFLVNATATGVPTSTQYSTESVAIKMHVHL